MRDVCQCVCVSQSQERQENVLGQFSHFSPFFLSFSLERQTMQFAIWDLFWRPKERAPLLLALAQKTSFFLSLFLSPISRRKHFLHNRKVQEAKSTLDMLHTQWFLSYRGFRKYLIQKYRKSVTLGFFNAKSQFGDYQNVPYSQKSLISESGTSKNLCNGKYCHPRLIRYFRKPLYKPLYSAFPLHFLHPDNCCQAFIDLRGGAGKKEWKTEKEIFYPEYFFHQQEREKFLSYTKSRTFFLPQKTSKSH